MRLPPRLLAITRGTLDAASFALEKERTVRAVERAARGGLLGVLVREPGLADRQLIELCERIRDALEAEHAGDRWLAVHDRVHLAAHLEADAVHLGFRSLDCAQARCVLDRAERAETAIGLSTHAGDEPSQWERADYLFFGPVRPTPSKQGLFEPTGFDALAAVAERARPRPVLGLGGLEAEHATDALAAGAHGVAALRGMLLAADPEQAARLYLRAVEGGLR